jgi:hypothetical protein
MVNAHGAFLDRCGSIWHPHFRACDRYGSSKPCIVAFQKGAQCRAYRAVVFEAREANERIGGGLFIFSDSDGKENAPLCGSSRFQDQFAPGIDAEVLMTSLNGPTLISDKFNTNVCY